MAKNIPASAHPAICHRWRAGQPCQTHAPHGSPLPRTGQPWTLTSTTGPQTGGFPSTGAMCSRRRCRRRGRVEGPGLPEPHVPGLLGLQRRNWSGFASPWAALVSPGPEQAAGGKGSPVLCCASGLAPWQHQQLAQLRAGTACPADRLFSLSWRLRPGAPALSSPQGCLAHGPQAVCPSEAGAELPSPQERNACRDTGHCHAGIQGTHRAGTQGTAVQGHRAHTVQGHRAHAVQGCRALLRRDTSTRCAGTQGTRCPASPLPSRCPSLHLCRQGCISAGELAAPAPAALHNQEIALHKRHLTRLFLNQLLFTPSSVPLAADCPLSPARLRSVAAQAAGPWRSRGRHSAAPSTALPSSPHVPRVPHSSQQGKVLGVSKLWGLIPAQAGGEPPGWALCQVLALAPRGCRALLLLPRSLHTGRWPESTQPAGSLGLSGDQAWGKQPLLQLAGQEEMRASRGLGWVLGRAPVPRG